MHPPQIRGRYCTFNHTRYDRWLPGWMFGNTGCLLSLNLIKKKMWGGGWGDGNLAAVNNMSIIEISTSLFRNGLKRSTSLKTPWLGQRKSRKTLLQTSYGRVGLGDWQFLCAAVLETNVTMLAWSSAPESHAQLPTCFPLLTGPNRILDFQCLPQLPPPPMQLKLASPLSFSFQ